MPNPPTVNVCPASEEMRAQEPTVQTAGMTRAPELSWMPCPTVGDFRPGHFSASCSDQLSPPSVDTNQRFIILTTCRSKCTVDVFASYTTEK